MIDEIETTDKAALINIKPDERLKLIRKLVDIQAKDKGLWFFADYPSEAYFQDRLRELHTIIESDDIDEIKRIIDSYG